MMYRTHAIRVWGSAGVVLCLLLGAGVRADTLVLTTGESLTGAVIEQAPEQVILDHPLLGRLVIAAGDVVSVAIDDDTPEDKVPADQTEVISERPVHGPADVEASSQKQVAAPTDEPAVAMHPGPQTVDPEVTAPAAPDAPIETPGVVPPPDPAPVIVPKGGFFDTGLFAGWKTRLSLGVSGYTGLNDRIDFYGKFDAKQSDERGHWRLKAEAFYADTPGGSARNEGRLETTKRWTDPDTQWFVFATGRYQYNRLKDWDERVSAYGGFGRTVVDNDGFELSAELGLGGNYEFGTVNDFTPEAVFGASALAWKLTPRQRLKATTTLYPNLEFLGDLRVETDLEWQFKVDAQTDTLFKIGLRHDYESRDTTSDRHDLKYFGALEFSF